MRGAFARCRQDPADIQNRTCRGLAACDHNSTSGVLPEYPKSGALFGKHQQLRGGSVRGRPPASARCQPIFWHHQRYRDTLTLQTTQGDTFNMPLTDLRIPALEPGATSRKVTAGMCRTGQDRRGFRMIRRKVCGNDEHCQIPAAAMFATLLAPDAGPSPRLPAKGDFAMARIRAFTLKGGPRTYTIRTLILNAKARPAPGREKGKGRGSAGFPLFAGAAGPVAAGREAPGNSETLSPAVSPYVPGPARPVRAAISRNTEDGAGIIRQDPGCPEFQEGPSCRRSGVAPRARRCARQEPERAE